MIKKWILKYLSYISIFVLVIGSASLLINKFVVVDEETLIATLSFWTYSYELSPSLYSAISFMSELPFFYTIIVIFNLLGLYLKMDKKQQTNEESQSNFNSLLSEGMKFIMLYTQHQVKEDQFLTDEQQSIFKTEANNLIEQFNLYTESQLDITDLPLLDKINLKNLEVKKWQDLLTNIKSVTPNSPRVQFIIQTIESILGEIQDLKNLLPVATEVV